MIKLTDKPFFLDLSHLIWKGPCKLGMHLLLWAVKKIGLQFTSTSLRLTLQITKTSFRIRQR